MDEYEKEDLNKLDNISTNFVNNGHKFPTNKQLYFRLGRWIYGREDRGLYLCVGWDNCSAWAIAELTTKDIGGIKVNEKLEVIKENI